MQSVLIFLSILLIPSTLLGTTNCTNIPLAASGYTVSIEEEEPADSAYAKVKVDMPGCPAANAAGCATTATDLKNLSDAARRAANRLDACANDGVNKSNPANPLSAAQKAWYSARSVFWFGLKLDLDNQTAAVNSGTYQFTPTFQSQYLGLPSTVKNDPALLTITSKVIDGAKIISGKAIPHDANSSGQPLIFACVWQDKPTATVSLDCTDPTSKTKAAALSKADGTVNSNSYVLVAKDDTYSLPLTNSLVQGQFVSIVQKPTATAGTSETIVSKAVTPVSPSNQCNKHPISNPFDDCDVGFSIVGGVEQSAQSSLPSATTPFLRVFTRADTNLIGNPENDKKPKQTNSQKPKQANSRDTDTANPKFDNQSLNLWAFVRLLGSPQASSTMNVVSAVTDPSGNITTQTFSGIGTSIDYMLGFEYMFRRKKTSPYSFSIIGGFGGTTPLPANTLAQAFKTPTLGTVECTTLQGRFATQFAADKIIPGTSSNTTGSTPMCLVNQNSPTVSSGSTTYTGISTIGFSNQDRSSFLGKTAFGIRTIDRFLGTGNVACGNTDTANQIGPCERGIVDFTFGQDATVTGGKMRGWVFKVDAVHPLPVKSVTFIYLFGTVILRLQHDQNLPPLVLQAGDIASLTGNGSNAVPSTSVVILPLTQPNRDFYRFGAGINVSAIFSKLFSAPAPKNP